MTTAEFFDPRLTEQRNPHTVDIDVASSLEVVDLINGEDHRVPEVVHGVRNLVAQLVDLVVAAFADGGRLVYVGAGTSGRLGVLDAAECPPTFGTAPELVVGIIAGGPQALVQSQEGAEDDVRAGELAMDEHSVSAQDVVVGIAASGTTPYVGAALRRAKAVGARTALVTCADPPQDLIEVCDVVVVARVGPEVLTGSTRMKAGTATKLILNTITTGAMIRSGRAYGNLMVDLMARSEKLRDRGERIVMETCGVSRDRAREAIGAASGSIKLAIVMVRRGLRADAARRLLEQSGGSVRRAVGEPPPIGV